jgi:hypothetical protein
MTIYREFFQSIWVDILSNTIHSDQMPKNEIDKIPECSNRRTVFSDFNRRFFSLV